MVETGQSFELDSDVLEIFHVFESVTGVMPNDFVRFDNVYFFLVPFSLVKKAIGRDARNVKILEKKFKARVYIFGDADDPERFVRNFFNNVRISMVDVRDAMGEVGVFLVIDERDKKKVMGVGKLRWAAAKKFMKRKFNASLFLRTRRGI